MSISAIASHGMTAARIRLDQSAARVAGNSDATDPSTELVAQKTAVRDFKANVKVLAAGDAMMQSTLELWG